MNPIRPNKQGVFPRVERGTHSVCLGNMTMYQIVLSRNEDGLVIGIVGRGCNSFGYTPDWQDVREMLALMAGDAGNVSDFIADQLTEPGSIERQGTYYPKLCT